MVPYGLVYIKLLFDIATNTQLLYYLKSVPSLHISLGPAGKEGRDLRVNHAASATAGDSVLWSVRQKLFFFFHFLFFFTEVKLTVIICM